MEEPWSPASGASVPALGCRYLHLPRHPISRTAGHAELSAGLSTGWVSARAWKSVYQPELSVEHVQGRVCGMTPALGYRLVLKCSTCILEQLPT